ncbi:MAG: (d)CMP kinase [Pseudomonadales bacterium]|nr:(d)CMP kinase [Pseudomonadales bacterium]
MALDKKLITIDGPSGAGKGTVSQRLAKQLGWAFLDSGAIYRLCGLACLKSGIAFEDVAAVAELARNLDIEFKLDGEVLLTLLDGEEVTAQLRTEEGGAAASRVAPIAAVREALLLRQRAFASDKGLVADGRDMGTIVFPDAPIKVYLTASAEERANRRYKQLTEAGNSVNLRAILEDIQARDARDMNREVAPLKPADDAVVIDSTELSIDQVLAKILALLP